MPRFISEYEGNDTEKRRIAKSFVEEKSQTRENKESTEETGQTESSEGESK